MIQTIIVVALTIAIMRGSLQLIKEGLMEERNENRTVQQNAFGEVGKFDEKTKRTFWFYHTGRSGNS